MSQLFFAVLALPIVELTSYFIIITKFNQYLKNESKQRQEKMRHIISSTSMVERRMMMLQDDLLSKSLTFSCILALIFLIGLSYLEQFPLFQFLNSGSNQSLQAHFIFTFSLSLLALYTVSSKLSFYIYTIGITTSLLLTDVQGPNGNIIFISRSMLALESAAYFLGYKGLLFNVGLNMMCYFLLYYCHFEGWQLVCLKDKIVNDLNFEYIFALLWFCNYSFRVEHRNEKLMQMLGDSIQERTDFLANISHQLRTPLFGIVGSLDILQNEGLTHSQYATVKIIQSCCENLLSTISDILDLSNIEYGKITLKESLINLYSLVNDTIEIVHSQIVSKGLRMNKILDKPLPKYFLGDELRMMQILVNLLSNSTKFTPPGGSIYLIITADPDLKGRLLSPGYMNQIEKLFMELSQDGFYAKPSLISSADDHGRSTRHFNHGTRENGISSDDDGRLASKDCLSTSEAGTSTSGNSLSGGEVHPPVRKRRPSTSLFMPQEENYVCMLYFIIADTGIGITQAQRDYIFTPFFRTNLSTSSSKEDFGQSSVNDGVGLGLTIAKYFVEEMNGHIDFYSEGYNKGGVFCIGIPYKVPRVEIRRKKVMNVPKLARASTREEISVSSFPHLSANKQPLSCKSVRPIYPDEKGLQPHAHSLVKALPSAHILNKSVSSDGFRSVLPPSFRKEHSTPTLGRVLIVEDNEVNRSIIQKMVKRFGYHTDIAENGRIAVEQCRRKQLRGESYSLILMDIEMPFLGGIETAKILRDELKLDTPIIALSAHAIVEIRELALQSGFNDFITKPFSNKTLLKAIQKIKSNESAGG